MYLLLGFVTKLSAAVNFSSDELSPLTHAPKSVDLRMIQCGLELVTLVGSTASSFMNEIPSSSASVAFELGFQHRYTQIRLGAREIRPKCASSS
jgi:hypothetical protein